MGWAEHIYIQDSEINEIAFGNVTESVINVNYNLRNCETTQNYACMHTVYSVRHKFSNCHSYYSVWFIFLELVGV